MLYRPGNLQERDEMDPTEYYRRQAIGNLRGIAYHLIDCLQGNVDQPLLYAHYATLEEALERLWDGVMGGYIQIESIAILRMLRTVTCYDLKRHFMQPVLRRDLLIRDLRLFINTVEYVLLPPLYPRGQYDSLLRDPY
jgi:hypothetical protein